MIKIFRTLSLICVMNAVLIQSPYVYSRQNDMVTYLQIGGGCTALALLLLMSTDLDEMNRTNRALLVKRIKDLGWKKGVAGVGAVALSTYGFKKLYDWVEKENRRQVEIMPDHQPPRGENNNQPVDNS